ncbi:MAG: hypothetical protein HW421_2197 [Ignavibacteria bacterium]|nr:hypothetical protein [Ignavibacteria bacterium]
MSMNPVNWFEIPVTDMMRAKEFYSSLLKMEMTDMNMPEMEMASFPFHQEGMGASGALVRHEHYKPSFDGTVICFSCEDCGNEIGMVEQLGGKIIMPKTSIGEHGFYAQATDTEGNRISFHSMK